MAIFKCVGYFYFDMPEGFCFAVFSALFSRCHTLHISICVFPVLFSFVIFAVSLQADKHTRKETTKITKQNSTGTKHRWKICRVTT
jgi:hypothetical protein